eukprot:TRINITY_DN4672_c0_g2_i1.p1 TRINITY_DN4672_c0_g2~~TRINITY_DN4672_c0_g2_i1.p1  ORF type:complete len:312 (+),score=61.29 TRINITY_DN4672_c0_g2_i1:72-1007(+)
MLLLLIASVPLVLASVAFSAPTSAPTAAIEAAVSQAPTATTTATTAAAANAGDGLDVPTLAVDAGSLSVAQLVCNGRCSGLSTFWRDVGNEWSALPPEAGGAVRCQAVRRHAATVRCALDLWDEPSCLDIRKEFVDLSMNCTSWGVDVAEDAVGDGMPGMYENSGHGAVLLKMFTGSPKVKCQRECDNEASCAAYDFDLPRQLCRLWSSCPACARAKDNCPWNVYEKPGATHVATSVPSGGKGCGAVHGGDEGSTYFLAPTEEQPQNKTSSSSGQVAIALGGAQKTGERSITALTTLLAAAAAALGQLRAA